MARTYSSAVSRSMLGSRGPKKVATGRGKGREIARKRGKKQRDEPQSHNGGTAGEWPFLCTYVCQAQYPKVPYRQNGHGVNRGYSQKRVHGDSRKIVASRLSLALLVIVIADCDRLGTNVNRPGWQGDIPKS